jgi:hypothetical protein
LQQNQEDPEAELATRYAACLFWIFGILLSGVDVWVNLLRIFHVCFF